MLDLFQGCTAVPTTRDTQCSTSDSLSCVWAKTSLPLPIIFQAHRQLPSFGKSMDYFLIFNLKYHFFSWNWHLTTNTYQTLLIPNRSLYCILYDTPMSLFLYFHRGWLRSYPPPCLSSLGFTLSTFRTSAASCSTSSWLTWTEELSRYQTIWLVYLSLRDLLKLEFNSYISNGILSENPFNKRKSFI